MATVTESSLSTIKKKTERGERGFPGPAGPVTGGVYPGAGIAVSTGAAWGASITNNSANWNTAYGWGNHASAGYAPVANPTFTGNVGIGIAPGDSQQKLQVHTASNTNLSIRPGSDFGAGYSGSAIDSLNDAITVRKMLILAGNPIVMPGGNVGIGTTTPLSKLTINGNDGSAREALDVRGTTTSTNATAGIAAMNINATSSLDVGHLSTGSSSNYIQRWLKGNGTTDPHSSVVAVINTSGNVGIGFTSPLGKLCIDGGLHVGGASDPGDNNLLVDGIAQEPNFISGWQGNNWQIQADGDAEFNNVLIRGGLSVYELIINQLHYQNGGLIIGAGAGKIDTIVSGTAGSEVLTFHDPEGNDMVPFSAGAIVMCLRVDINRTDVVKKIVRRVASISGMEVTLATTTGWTTGDDTGVFETGDEVCAIGHLTNDSLDSCIYMSATDADNPFLRVLDGVNSYSKFSLGDKTTIKLQLGNLASLASYDILPASPGYGLYSDNCYLKGKIVASSGSIGGWQIDTDAIFTGTKYLTDDWTSSGVTFGADGSLHSPNLYINDDGEIGVRATKLIYAYTGVSDTVILSHDATATTAASSYTKLKTITLGGFVKEGQILRIKFDLTKSTLGDIAYGQIYRNGVAVGTEQTNTTTSPETKTEDIAGWDAGDTIEVWGFIEPGGAGQLCTVENFRVCGTHSSVTNEITGTYS